MSICMEKVKLVDVKVRVRRRVKVRIEWR